MAGIRILDRSAVESQRELADNLSCNIGRAFAKFIDQRISRNDAALHTV